MRRVGHLFPDIVAHANLLAAFRLAMQGCGHTRAVCRFFFHLEPEILCLQQSLIDGTYRPGRHRYFMVFDPKQRTIAVAPFRDRVVHHAVVRVLTPIYEKRFVHDSYATRKGKGTHAAVKRAQVFCRGFRWYLKTDIAKYFDSVDHHRLLGIVAAKIKDRQVLQLLERIVRNSRTAGKGLPIGNLTSQFLANVYLDPLDHLIKERLGVKGYLRYMDDMVLFGDSKADLRGHLNVVETYLADRLGLRLKPRATQLNRTAHGLSFLGMRVFGRFIRIRPANRRRSLKRMARCIGQWQAGQLEEDKMAQSLTSIAAHLRYFCPRMGIDLGAVAE